MTLPVLSLDQLDKVYKIEKDWLFEKLLDKLNAQRHLILSTAPGWGVQDYIRELGFQLSEKDPDIHVCYMDIKQTNSINSFLEMYMEALTRRFPEVTSHKDIEGNNLNKLALPALIAKRKKIRVAVFLANSHLFHRFRDAIPFLRTMKLKLRRQKNCIFCLYGNKTPYFRELVQYPGPLSGFGQLFELRHNSFKFSSAGIRKIFHNHDKDIEYNCSVHMSYAVENHPFYLKLLVWHALIRTQNTCTKTIVDEALNDLVHHFDYSFCKILESLTPKQLSFLKALVEGHHKLYSSAIREEYQLGSTSNIVRIKQSLERKGIISNGYMYSEFSDPIFRKWFRRHLIQQNAAIVF